MQNHLLVETFKKIRININKKSFVFKHKKIEEGRIDKGWGHEQIIVSNLHYCLKFLVFEKEGAQCSMHFHKNKDESWFLNEGNFKLRWIDTQNATLLEKELKPGDTWRNSPLMPHQLECLSDFGSVTEVSTADDPNDNYRIIRGDSQSKEIVANNIEK
jgi:uncharacterized RmlC-like cupin family protein